jgi:hypothetical protein
VQLAVGGPRHGTLILDPDGHQVACSRAAFLWHEDPEHPNDQFGYTMGTYSAYVGVEPDPNNPPQVRPVWGTAEALGLAAQAKALVNGAPADPLLVSYGVHPKPGKPDHFFCLDGLLRPCSDTFAYWTHRYQVSPSHLLVVGSSPFSRKQEVSDAAAPERRCLP